MYFALEINEQLANAMRAVAEAKAEIGMFLKAEEAKVVKSVSIKEITEVDDTLRNAIINIAMLSGCVIAGNVMDESNNRINENK